MESLVALEELLPFEEEYTRDGVLHEEVRGVGVDPEKRNGLDNAVGAHVADEYSYSVTEVEEDHTADDMDMVDTDHKLVEDGHRIVVDSTATDEVPRSVRNHHSQIAACLDGLAMMDDHPCAVANDVVVVEVHDVIECLVFVAHLLVVEVVAAAVVAEQQKVLYLAEAQATAVVVVLVVEQRVAPEEEYHAVALGRSVVVKLEEVEGP